MGTKKSYLEINKITERIIGCAYRVSNTLGSGFLEKVYENAFAYELNKAGLKVSQQYPIQVKYDGVPVGDYIADLIVEDCVLVELKTVNQIDSIHLAHCMNYLKATSMNICLLFNFANRRLEFKQIVHNLPEPINEVNTDLSRK
ncbi:MAG: GxxExxY protein [Chloroflexi bacterium RBG_19FT_COMBO_50_10]|nr:MAG: GxxExxY protein [Chloroflexi bacterium RBG_19FT_COMBO_50_10]